MYNPTPLPSPSAQPLHQTFAMEFVNEILERFNPEECNEMMLIIRHRLSEHTAHKIEALEKQVNSLKELLRSF